MEIGTRLKAKRTEHGWTQEQLAEKLFVTRQAISNWENNRTYPDISNLILLSELYEVPLQALIQQVETERDNTFTPEQDQKSQKYAKITAAVLFLFSIIVVVSAILFKMSNLGPVVLYAALSLFIVSIYAGFMYKLGVASEKMFYTIAALIVLIFALVSLESLN
jgi:transcriptional regulator with XRE-family HTH domain